MNHRLLTILLGLLCLVAPANGQQIIIDTPMSAGDLTLFPTVDDPNTYYYLPDQPRLARAENGQPKFSFLRYVRNVTSGANEAEATEGEGGGIVHAVIALDVSEEQLRDAEQELRRKNSSGQLIGPVMYRGGTVALISSFANADGELTEQVLGLGAAPLLDGHEVAISIQLTKQGALILWESFQTPTPDMSISFEMELSGYMSPRRAVIEADFEQIYEHKNFNAGVATPYLAAEIKAAYDDLVKTGAIKMTQVGEDEQMEGLLTTAYNKLLQMMFDPLGGTGTPNLQQLTAQNGAQGSMLDRATKMLKDARKEAKADNQRIRQENRRRAAIAASTPVGPSRPTPAAADTSASEETSEADREQEVADNNISHAEANRFEEQAAQRVAPSEIDEVSEPKFAIAASFEMKRIRQRGEFKIDLNKYTTETRSLRFDENFGQIRCDACFHQVNLDDPLYRQRELVAFLDGLNSEDFGQYVNFVNVTMRKKHQSGETTMREVRIDRNNFNAEGNNFKLMYGWKGDENQRNWFDYDYRMSWSFFGGHTEETDWSKGYAGTISVSPPFQRRIVDVEADPELIAEANVRSITVNLFYELGGKEQTRQITLNPRKEQFSERIEFMSPKDELAYAYEVTWRLRGNQSVTSGRQETTESILFVDELPVQ